MERACSMYGGDKECNLKGGNHLGDTEVDGKILLK
jgi:hypothetical protein